MYLTLVVQILIPVSQLPAPISSEIHTAVPE